MGRSQDELAKEINSSRVMIGKYKGEDNSPSIEVIVKLAKAFQVSVDYLLGEGPNASYDKEMIKRLDELETLPEDEERHIFHYMDLIIRGYKPTVINPQVHSSLSSHHRIFQTLLSHL
jgi:transcriptional regulator with XRE-family HTH domain